MTDTALLVLFLRIGERTIIRKALLVILHEKMALQGLGFLKVTFSTLWVTNDKESMSFHFVTREKSAYSRLPHHR